MGQAEYERGDFEPSDEAFRDLRARIKKKKNDSDAKADYLLDEMVLDGRRDVDDLILSRMMNF